MTNRREFLQIGIAAGALPLASGAAFAVAAPSAGPVPLYKIVCDTRFPESAAFGRRARALGLATHEIEGDITSFWYQELDALWRAGASPDARLPGVTPRPGATAIAGLTAHGPLFCLERLAWDRRMRVVFRASHTALAPGSVEHRLEGPVSMLRPDIGRDDDAHAWPRTLADLVASCPQGRTEIASARFFSAGSSALQAGSDPLYTWVIAPAVRARHADPA